jgi:hypothetical protein
VTSKQMPSARLSAVDWRGAGIRIRFIWKGDRYGHQIDVLEGDYSKTLLESVEGDPQGDSPPSPPLQQVNVSWIASDTQQGHVAMLVGAAGDNQWSMCVSAHDRNWHEQYERDNTELFFDVACRTNNPARFLGCTYRTLFHQVAISDRLNCAFVPADSPGLVVVPRDAQVELDSTQMLSPILRCRATETRFNELPATVRWRYAIRRSSGGSLRVSTKRRTR